MNQISDKEIIALLGGATAVARLVKVRPPSVQGWMVDGIPEGRLIELAAEIERRAPERFSRRSRWPDRCHLIWPDLADPAPTTAQDSKPKHQESANA
jgi:DNA-binding transcriptional regulator YdaS (Cro superfamily)